MNLKMLDAVKTQIAGIDVGTSAEAKLLTSSGPVSLDALNKIETDIQNANAAITAATNKASEAIVGPVTRAVEAQVSKLLNPVLTAPTTQFTAPTFINMAFQADNLKAFTRLPKEVTQLTQKMASVTSAANSKINSLNQLSTLVASKKAALSAADLAKLDAMPKPNLNAVVGQVSQRKASLDLKFANIA